MTKKSFRRAELGVKKFGEYVYWFYFGFSFCSFMRMIYLKELFQYE